MGANSLDEHDRVTVHALAEIVIAGLTLVHEADDGSGRKGIVAMGGSRTLCQHEWSASNPRLYDMAQWAGWFFDDIAVVPERSSEWVVEMGVEGLEDAIVGYLEHTQEAGLIIQMRGSVIGGLFSFSQAIEAGALVAEFSKLDPELAIAAPGLVAVCEQIRDSGWASAVIEESLESVKHTLVRLHEERVQ